ncbi:hypothetical protein [Micromonospora sp. URMC 103]|uniref:hypothetical protein n=1 Tax=Micromonospora sp. URMC 103 TaxID=3423406 RepID=UPI003F1A6A4D
MSYQLSAVIADADVLREHTAGLDHAVLGELRQDFALLPVTPQLVEELTGALPDYSVEDRDDRHPFELVLGPALTETWARWSGQGPVAYVEAEFAGGLGYQSAAVWLGGALRWGPHVDTTFNRPRERWPINAALVELGVEPGPWIDAFAELGLHLERSTEGWLAHGRRRLSADYWDDLADEWEAGQSGG